ncbi:uncharacterized protein YdcI [Condylostylus longicornis]|uniref:uncharacterized protein YdcI n=1 Tax=Condylostylus longicornis TaxID=2530218 RepID=UPI00244E2C32|nr:uncharacterized protein YdcI [Condylostylus longicornis]
MTTRPKRTAAKVKNIIEISDSESESEPAAKKVKESDEDCSSVDSDFRVEGNKIVVKPPAKKRIGRPKKNSVTKSKIENNDVDVCTETHLNPHPWKFHDLLAEKTSISSFVAQNIVTLLSNDNTIPFICRYRKDMVGNISPEKMRDIKICFQEILNLQQKADNIIKTLEKDNLLKDSVKNDILAAKTLEELEFLYAPYKPANKGSLADRARALGLEEVAEDILYGNSLVKLESKIDKNVKGLDSKESILEGIVHIISHIISKNTEVLEELRRIQKIHRIIIKCSKSTSATKEKKQVLTNNVLKLKSVKEGSRKSNEYKFEIYYNFENAVRYIKPHQILAINRGEKAKCLSVKVIVPDRVKNEMKHYIRQLFLTNGQRYQLRNEIFERSYEECYVKKLLPFLQRQVRSDLNEIAKKASIEVFAKNLKQLLLMSPLKGKKILGIDPGFSNGCKMALISETADVLDTGVIFPHTKGENKDQGRILVEMLEKHNCNLIALGNGTACRETEHWLTNLFKDGMLDPEKIKYSIVSEQGASIYSCSENARKEFPNLDVNIISAISIARRLNDPLSEYVKIEPRHIGVGMYQHDVNEKDLSEALNEVVTECVSFVGVDINTASLSILKYISGLTASRAEKLIEYRIKNGPFRTRRAIVKVKSIGEKTYTQCAGFIRIDPMTVGGSISNYLDCTWVHPESYDVAKSIIESLNFKVKDIGQAQFMKKMQEISNPQIEVYAREFNLPKERIECILEGLKREPFKDYRLDFDKKPLFKSGVSKITDLSLMDIVTGAVTNVTHFGAFVDIGVEKDCLLHVSKMNGMTLNIGDRIECSVVDIDTSKNRVNLRLEGMAI